jgi:hypothetical protein
MPRRITVCIEAAQGSDQQVEAVGADRRLIRRLHEPSLDSACSECTAGLEQEQPRVLTNRLGLSVPLVAALGHESEPRPQHGQVRFTRSRRTDAFHEAVPLVDWDDELAIGIEDKPLIPPSTGWIGEISTEPQRTGAVQATELTARLAGCA